MSLFHINDVVVSAEDPGFNAVHLDGRQTAGAHIGADVDRPGSGNVNMRQAVG